MKPFTAPSLHRSLLLLIILAMGCAGEKEQEPPLFRAGGKSVSSQEFRRRCEFTIIPRPFRDKSILLDNLIAEKLLAAAAERSAGTELAPRHAAMLQGIKEQKMRELLFKQVASHPVPERPSEQMERFRISQVEYQLAWQTVTGAAAVVQARQAVAAGDGAAYFAQLSLAQVPGQRTVQWDDPALGPLETALFSRVRHTGEVIGPVEVEEGIHLLVKIQGWRNQPVIGAEEQQVRMRQLEARRQQQEENRAWQSWTRAALSGTRIEFNPEVFDRLLALYQSRIKAAAEENITPAGQEGDEPGLAEIWRRLEEEPEAPFFQVNDRLWTVADFRQAVAVHPLVFSTADPWNMPVKIRFRNAVAGLVRDQRLTELAAAEGLDRDPEVMKHVAMWQDALLALRQRQCVLEEAVRRGEVDKDSNRAKKLFLDRYIAALPKEPGLEVAVDYRRLTEITLTPIDMMVLQRNVPWPRAVPGFPLYTSGLSLRWPELE